MGVCFWAQMVCLSKGVVIKEMKILAKLFQKRGIAVISLLFCLNPNNQYIVEVLLSFFTKKKLAGAGDIEGTMYTCFEAS